MATRYELERIDSFTGDFRFLSNFYILDNPIYDDMRISYNCVECAYQAYKSEYRGDRLDIQRVSPMKAKIAGQNLKCRPNWEVTKRPVMMHFVLQKYLNNRPLLVKLLSTGQAELIEGNNHGDVYWGMVNGKGENNLGRIHMTVRELLL